MTASESSAHDIELRIHGVSGTPVVSMLDVGTVHRVAGDDTAGFWRVGEADGADIPTANGTVLEGYRWGGLTSGAAKAAAWVFLAPFALVNAAAAAHLPGTSKPEDRDGIASGFEGTLVRWVALSLSLTFVLTVYISTVDVVGWQCGNPLHPNQRHPHLRPPKPVCTRHTSYTHFLSWHFFDSPARHIVVTMLGPLFVLGLVWFLAHKSWQRYEGYQAGSAHGLVREDGTRTPFDDPGFWNGKARAEMLRRLHVAACLAGLSAMVLWARIAIHTQSWSKFVVPPLMIAALIVLGAVVIITGFTALPGRAKWASRLLRAAVLVMVVTLASTWLAELRHTTKTTTGTKITRFPVELPGVANVVTVLLAVQLGLVLAVWFAGVATNKKSPDPVRAIGLKGCTSACLCLIALVIAGAFSIGTIMRVADLLGTARPHTEVGSRVRGHIVTPDAFTWMARGTVAAAAVIVLWAIFVGRKAHRAASKRTDEHYRQLTSLFPDPATKKARDAAGEQRTKKVHSAIELAKLTDRAGNILGPAAVMAFGFALVATVFASVATLHRPSGFLTNEHGNAWRTWTASTGTWLIVGFAGALIGLTVSAYRNEGKRRQVGILWDLASFWPRSAHPLAPPCYAERTVPEYAARATFLRYGPLRFDESDPQLAEQARAEATGLQREVILSAHSQGSIIAAAALLQLRDTTGLRLLTYGCPLDRLYARFFPSYFGGPTLEILLARLTTTDDDAAKPDPEHPREGRWRNLYRETDPIGAWVFAKFAPDGTHIPLAVDQGGNVDTRVPIPSTMTPGDTVYPAIEGHSRYPREKLYSTKLNELRNLS